LPPNVILEKALNPLKAHALNSHEQTVCNGIDGPPPMETVNGVK
jgi:hypothetical protein